MKVIFLDVDGVLNCGTTTRTINGFLFVDPDKLGRLASLVGATGAKIVLSSTWRYGKIRNIGVAEYIALEQELALHGLEIMDCTPYTREGYRGNEIQFWLTCWNGDHEDDPVTHFVILDDDTDMEPFMDHLVNTSFDDGFNDAKYLEAMDVLHGNLRREPESDTKRYVGKNRQTFN